MVERTGVYGAGLRFLRACGDFTGFVYCFDDVLSKKDMKPSGTVMGALLRGRQGSGKPTKVKVLEPEL